MPAATPEEIEAARVEHVRIAPGFQVGNGDAFDRYFEITERVVWPELWFGNSDALDLKTRSLCTLAALTALNSPVAAAHVRSALNSGATKDEVAEVILQMAFYGGWAHAGMAIKAARAVFEEFPD